MDLLKWIKGLFLFITYFVNDVNEFITPKVIAN